MFPLFLLSFPCPCQGVTSSADRLPPRVSSGESSSPDAVVGDKKGEKKHKGGEKAETKRSKKGKGDKDKPSKKRKKDDDDDHNPLPDGGSDDDEDGDDEDGNFGLEGLEDILKDESDQKSTKKKPATNATKKRPAKREGKKREEGPSKLPSSSTYLFCTCAVVFLKNFYRSQLYSAVLGRYFSYQNPKTVRRCPFTTRLRCVASRALLNRGSRALLNRCPFTTRLRCVASRALLNQ